MSSFWHWYIWIIPMGMIIGLFLLIQLTRKVATDVSEDETMGHSFDGIEEYNKPLPAWWLYMFWGTMVFGIGYLFYFGLGNWNGFGNWSSIKQLEQETAAHEAKYGEIFSKYAAIPIEDLLNEPAALKMGQRMYLNNCSVCHGTSATGAYGFPNLTDNDWLYGGSADAIKTSLVAGRRGQMPAWGDALGESGVAAVSHYVMKLSGNEHNANQAAAGEALYLSSCAACHGVDGVGNQALGAPNLTDDIWLYDNPSLSLFEDIKITLEQGRAGNMPAWNDILGEEKVHIISAYVYSLTN